jgi:arginine-tRNA-protein transferase
MPAVHAYPHSRGAVCAIEIATPLCPPQRGPYAVARQALRGGRTIRRYIKEWHQGENDNRQAFEEFLYDSPTQTIEFSYRNPQGKLVAAGICDVCAASLSSVYFYFDPEEAWRGLGTYGAMQEIAFAQRASIAYYYLGYWVNGCGAMEYKSSFRPFELLYPDGIWRERGGDGWGP